MFSLWKNKNVFFKHKYFTNLCSLNKCSTNVNEIDSDSPLKGIKIIDLTRIIAGPYCTMILGDLGAQIYKIEKPETGDECRKWGPPFVNNSNESCYFVSVNRNKKSVCVDISSKEGRKIIYDLARKCDVFVENYVPGKLEQYKLGYEHLKEIAPKLIYCSINGYGSLGLHNKKPGYDVIAASVGGFLHITGPLNGEPVKAGVAVTDIATGLYAHGAILAALYKRERTGQGQKVECNLLSTQIAMLINIGSNYLNAGKEGRRLGTSHESIVPYQTFRTKNGYYTISSGSDLHFVDLCNRLHLKHLAIDERFTTNQKRLENRNTIEKILEEVMVKKTNVEWNKVFEGATFPCGPVNNLAETFSDPHVTQIGIVKEVKHTSAGFVKVVGPPVVYSEGGNFVRSSPPLLGEHTKEVLSDLLNYDDVKIKSLFDKKIIA